MKIAVWSENSSHGIYEGIMALSTVSSFVHNENTIVMQGNNEFFSVDFGFTPVVSSNVMKEDFEYYNKRGMDQIMGRALGNVLAIDNIWDNLVHIPKSRLFYMPASRIKNKELFDAEFGSSYKKIINVIDKMQDKVYIALQYGMNEMIQSAAECMDRIIICIPQCANAISDEILNNKSLMDKSVFVVNDYDSKSKYNIKNMRRKYRFGADKLYYIPHNVQFKDAVYDGRTYEFVRKYIKSTSENENTDFVHNVRNLVASI